MQRRKRRLQGVILSNSQIHLPQGRSEKGGFSRRRIRTILLIQSTVVWELLFRANAAYG
jgi:hypothetical protein